MTRNFEQMTFFATPSQQRQQSSQFDRRQLKVASAPVWPTERCDLLCRNRSHRRSSECYTKLTNIVPVLPSSSRPLYQRCRYNGRVFRSLISPQRLGLSARLRRMMVRNPQHLNSRDLIDGNHPSIDRLNSRTPASQVLQPSDW